MSNTIRITYTENYTIADQDIEAKLAKAEEATSDAILSSAEREKMAQARAADLQTMIARKNEQLARENGQQLAYSYNGEFLVYERERHAMPRGEWIIVTPEAEMRHYYLNQGGKAVFSETPWHRAAGAGDWAYTIQVTEDKAQKRQILGYDCHLLTVTLEERHPETGLHERHRYELYVTTELKLPAWLLIPLPEAAVTACALEIKSTNMDSPHSFSRKTAVAIEQPVAPEVFELPERYRDAVNVFKI